MCQDHADTPLQTAYIIVSEHLVPWAKQTLEGQPENQATVEGQYSMDKKQVPGSEKLSTSFLFRI